MDYDKKILSDFRRDLESAGIRPEKMILFGSRARGDALKNSDYDVVVISEVFKGVPFPRRLMDIEDAYNGIQPIESLAYTPQEYEIMKKKSYVVAAASKEGVGF
jgi:uncharacterized protein